MGHLSSDGEPDENDAVARGRGGRVVIYERRGEVGLEVRLDGETLWLTLAQMAELFARDKSVVSRHLSNIFRSKELDRVSVVAENATTAADGKTYSVEYFNLDAILSVGYRVNSKEGTRFRIWATRTLREHVLKGFTLNERRLREKGLGEMEQAVSLLARTLDRHVLVTDEGRAVLDVVMGIRRGSRSSRTGWPSASCITRRSTATSRAFGRTRSSRWGKTSSARPTGRCCGSGSRASTCRRGARRGLGRCPSAEFLAERFELYRKAG